VPLTKTDLIAAVAAHTGTTSKDVATVLGGLEDVITANVAKGEKVVITGFLTFDRAQRAARTGRNPQTGEAITGFLTFLNEAPAPKITKAK
jgi:DNA-binding protein HU-beta